MFKSIQPTDNPDYVLIHKKALLVNTFVIGQLSRTLATFIDMEADQIALDMGNLARNEVHSMSTSKINARVQQMMDGVDQKGLTIVD